MRTLVTITAILVLAVLIVGQPRHAISYQPPTHSQVVAWFLGQTAKQMRPG